MKSRSYAPSPSPSPSPSPLLEYRPTPQLNEYRMDFATARAHGWKGARYAPYAHRRRSPESAGEEDMGLHGLNISSRSVSPPQRLHPTYTPPREAPAARAVHRAREHRRTQSLSSVTYCVPAFVLHQSTSRPRSTPLRQSTAGPSPIPLPLVFQSPAGSQATRSASPEDYPPTPAPAPAPTAAPQVVYAPSAIPCRLPSSTAAAAAPAPIAATTPRKPSPPMRRLMLVNPSVAAHLKNGGSVSVKSADGLKSWRMYLPPSPVLSRAI